MSLKSLVTHQNVENSNRDLASSWRRRQSCQPDVLGTAQGAFEAALKPAQIVGAARPNDIEAAKRDRVPAPPTFDVQRGLEADQVAAIRMCLVEISHRLARGERFVNMRPVDISRANVRFRPKADIKLDFPFTAF